MVDLKEVFEKEVFGKGRTIWIILVEAGLYEDRPIPVFPKVTLKRKPCEGWSYVKGAWFVCVKEGYFDKKHV